MASAFAMSERTARMTKERMARCNHNDAVCVGNALVDGLASDRNQGGRPAPYPGGRDKVVVIYGQTDTCSRDIRATIAVSPGRLQNAIDQCASLTGNSWSVAIDERCEDVSDGDARTVCTNAVIRANSQN